MISASCGNTVFCHGRLHQCLQAFCNGAWQVVDYFTGKTGNSIFGS